MRKLEARRHKGSRQLAVFSRQRKPEVRNSKLEGTDASSQINKSTELVKISTAKAERRGVFFKIIILIETLRLSVFAVIKYLK